MERSRFRAWLIALGVIVLAFVGTVVTLNLTVYSATGFARSYLDALARHDLSGALATPGVALPEDGSRALLRADAMGSIAHIRLVSDSDSGNGSHRLVYSYRADGVSARTSFSVERAGSTLGLFSAWRFSTSPASILSVTPLHAGTFTANGITLTPKTGQDVAADYIVLAPTAVAVSHNSTWLTAAKHTAVVSRAGGATKALVTVVPKPAFLKEAQKEVNAYLAKCVTQKVLLPTGCPMGQQISDRVQNSPAWSMVTNPVVRIVPGNVPASWVVPATPGVAHLKVMVKSIFDGSLSTFDKDVPFTVSYVITFQADGSLLITAQG